MKVVYLTAGAAGMYCGSCMRDNTLTAALRAKGRDVTLVPLYTPIRTDEPDVSEPCVFYGGVNVFLQQRSALFRHTPSWMDRVLDSPALLRRLVRGTTGVTPEELAQLTLSTLRGEDGNQRKESHRLLRWLRRVRPDLVNLPNALFVHLARPIHRDLGVPVLCTLTGEDIFLDKLPEPERSTIVELIRTEGQHVDGYVALSRYYADYCCDRFAIPPEKMHVVRPGVRIEREADPAQLPDSPFRIGYLARICRDKGLHVLCDAVRILLEEGRNVCLVVAGYLGPDDRAYFENIRHRLAQWDLTSALDDLEDVDRAGKMAMLRSLHVLSVPTVYREAKGLFVPEALAQGVPVVLPRHGAFPEWIEATRGGLLVEPDHPEELARALARLMDDKPLREKFGCQGRDSVVESFTDHVMADETWAVYQQYGKTGNG